MGSLTTLSVYLGLTAITIATVSSGLREQVPGMSSSEICQNHTVLNDHWREIGSERGDNCDSHMREGWYRLMTTDGHSSSLPTTCIKNHVCGVVVALWLDLQGDDLPQPGHTVRGFVCGSYPVLSVWQCCVVRETAFVHNCGNYFLYWLRPTDRCSVGYCGEGPQSDISPHTVKTGENADNSGDRFRRRLRLQRNDGAASNEHPNTGVRSIRDVSTPDDLSCPEGQIRCSNNVCVASHQLCSSEESTSVSSPTTEHVTRAPITFYFSVLRDGTRAPVSFTSGQPALSAHTNVEGTTVARLSSTSLSEEEETKHMLLDGETTHSITTQMPATSVELTIHDDLSTVSSDGSFSLFIDLSDESERSLSTFTAGSSDSDYSSNTTPGSHNEIPSSSSITDFYTNQQSTTASLTDITSKPIVTGTTNTMADADLRASYISVTESSAGTPHTRNQTIHDTWRHQASQNVVSCSACLQPSVTSLPMMSEILTDSLSDIASLDLATSQTISTHVIGKEQMPSIVSTRSSSTVISQTGTSFMLQPTTSRIVQQSPSSTSSQQVHSSTTSKHAPSNTALQNVPSSSSHHALSSTASQHAISSTSSQHAPSSTFSQNAPSFTSSQNAPSSTFSQNAPSFTSSHNTPSSTFSQNAPSFTSSQNAPSSTSSQQQTTTGVLQRTVRPDISPSVTAVIPSKVTAVTTSPSPSTTDVGCTQCIQVVFNLRVAVKDKQTKRDFHASVKSAFSRMLTEFQGRRFYRDVRNTTHHRNSTHFVSTDIYIRNSTSSGNITVLVLEAKNPTGDFVADRYLAFLLQQNEVRRSLEQDLSVYGATLTEFSVSPTDTNRPEDEGGVTSIFSRHFGLFLTVIILSSFVVFVGLIAMVYVRNKARTGMWYCPSGTRYAKQLERTLLTKGPNWRVGQMTSPIPDVDILSDEGLMTETTQDEDDSRRASYTREGASWGNSGPEVDTWVVPLEEAMDDGLADKEYDTRL